MAGTFPAGEVGRIWRDLKPSDKRKINTMTQHTVWMGYENITFNCHNPTERPVRFSLVLEDFPSITRPKLYEQQLVKVPLTAKAGDSRLDVPIRELKTVDGQRWLDLSHVCRLGFEVTKPTAEVELRFSDIRVRTMDETAGVASLRYGKNACPRCGRRVDDRNCNLCPFCGLLFNAPGTELKTVADARRLYPIKDTSASSVPLHGEAEAAKAGVLKIHHYDDAPSWESRAFLRFDPASLPAGKTVARAELRLRSTWGGKKIKAWLIPLMVFVPPAGQDDFDEKGLRWNNQPPAGFFVAQGGLYYCWREWVCVDVTGFLRKRLSEGREPFTFILRGVASSPASLHPHSMGHLMYVFSREAGDESRRPYLYIEME
jgi:hypothetical protein